MSMYGFFGGTTGYTAATDEAQTKQMRDMAQTQEALGRAEEQRLLRLRNEEAYQNRNGDLPTIDDGTGGAMGSQVNLAPGTFVDQTPTTGTTTTTTGGAQSQQAAPQQQAAPRTLPATGATPVTPRVLPESGSTTIPGDMRVGSHTEQWRAIQDEKAAAMRALAGTRDQKARVDIMGRIRQLEKDALTAQDNARKAQRGLPTVPIKKPGATTNPFLRPGAPDQSAAETARLGKSTTQPATPDQTTAETARLLGKPVPQQAAPQQAAPQPAAPQQAAGTSEYDAVQTPYDDVITKAAQAHGIDPVLFKRLLGTESSFKPDAVSPSGAHAGLGIAQINAVHGLPDEFRLDPNRAIPWAAQYLSSLLKKHNGDWKAALYEYKGASSDKGKAAMDGPIAKILGPQGTPTAAPSATAAAQPAVAATGTTTVTTTKQVTPKQAEVLFSPENINTVAQDAQNALGLTRLKLAEIQRQLRYAPDAATARTLRTQAVDLVTQAQPAVYKDLSVRAYNGDDSALTGLAGKAGVRFAATNQGYVVATQRADGQWVASGRPMDRATFINQLYSQVTGASAKRAESIFEARLKGWVESTKAAAGQAGKIDLENIKHLNALRLAEFNNISGIQKELLKYNLTKDDVKNLRYDGLSGKGLFSAGNKVFAFEPGKIENGVQTEPVVIQIQ